MPNIVVVLHKTATQLTACHSLSCPSNAVKFIVTHFVQPLKYFPSNACSRSFPSDRSRSTGATQVRMETKSVKKRKPLCAFSLATHMHTLTLRQVRGQEPFGQFHQLQQQQMWQNLHQERLNPKMQRKSSTDFSVSDEL
jgi:hypothetical protein